MYLRMCVCLSVAAERKTSLGYDWHPQCLKCEMCEKTLQPGRHSEVHMLCVCVRACLRACVRVCVYQQQYVCTYMPIRTVFPSKQLVSIVCELMGAVCVRV